MREDTQTQPPPRELEAETETIRDALFASPYGHVFGCCAEATAVLAVCLRRRGRSVTAVSCSYWPDPSRTRESHVHAICRVGAWGLDPTREQFHENAPLVFDADEEKAYYRVPPWRTPSLPHPGEAHVIYDMARWLRRDLPGPPEAAARRARSVVPFLEAVGLPELIPAASAAAAGAQGHPAPTCFCGEPRAGVFSPEGMSIPLCGEHSASLSAETAAPLSARGQVDVTL